MSTDLEVYEPAAAPAVTLFGTDKPADVVAAAAEAAKPLAQVVNQQELYKLISGKKHVLVEGWTLLGSMLGVFPVTVWTRKTEDANGWEARVEARTKHGEVVGAAEAMCTRDESQWRNRDDYAIRSMAQTRATSKALRQPLGFVMTLAGFQATPSEEMPTDDGPIEEAEIVSDPSGSVFPDQRDPSMTFKPPTTARGSKGDAATEAQGRMLARLRKKLVGEMSQPAEAIDAEIAKAETKAQASDLISKLKRLAGEGE